MSMQWMRALLVAALGWCAGAACAQDVAPTAASGYAQFQKQKAQFYATELEGFDKALAAAPDDVSTAVARCEFIANFTDDEESDWIESAPDDLARCGEWLHKRWPSAPEVQLFELEEQWDKDAVVALKLGDAIDHWPAPLRKRALAHMARVWSNDKKRGGELAVQAAELGAVEHVAKAIDHLVARKRFDEAGKLLDSAPPATDAWVAGAIVRAAMALPDQQAAWRVARRYEGSEVTLSPYVVASALLRAGKVQEAHRRLPDTKPRSAEDQQTVFDVALAAGDIDAAAAQVLVTDNKDFRVSIQRFAQLAHAAPSSFSRTNMLAMAFAFLFMIVGMVALAGLTLVPVHYRGLARRIRKVRTIPLYEHVNLLHAWYGLAVVLCVPMIAIAVMTPDAMAMALGGGTAKPSAMFQSMLWGSIAGLLCYLPVAAWIPRTQLIGDRATWRAWWRVPIAWAVLWVVGIVLSLWFHWTGGGGANAHTELVERVIGEGQAAFGGFGAFLVVALLGPVFEELTFRGLLLGGLSRHISFGWANTLQALVFALAHGDPPRFLFYFTMGLLCGGLVKKTRSLGPAIALHVLNNAFAVLVHML